MANHKSAEKRIRSSKRQTQVNRHWKTSIKTFEKRLRRAVENKKKEESEKLLRAFFSLVDKARKKGVIHKNTANRKKAGFSIRNSRIS